MRHRLRHLRTKPFATFLLALAAGLALCFAALAFYHHLTRRPTQPVSSAPAPIAASPSPQQSIGDKDKATLVLELFNPTDQSLSSQHSETNTAQQIEQIMATSYILEQCDRISKKDQHDTYRALIVYAQRTGLAANQATAQARVHHLAESAGVSYTLLYRRTNCDDPKLKQIRKQLLAWQKAYLK